jgi:hypothetical protein
MGHECSSVRGFHLEMLISSHRISGGNQHGDSDDANSEAWYGMATGAAVTGMAGEFRMLPLEVQVSS